MNCQATNAAGEPCKAPSRLVVDGLCPAHRPGGLARVREASTKGGAANAARHVAKGLEETELAPMETIEDAKRELDTIRRAILLRKIEHATGTAASRAVAEWVKAHSVGLTQRLVNDLQHELDAKTQEIAELRQQVAQRPRVLRADRA